MDGGTKPAPRANAYEGADAYEGLATVASFARLADRSLYAALPDDWVLGLADVVRSTEAIAVGRYKAVNTADSMVGHRTPRHAAYGWAAARLDDFVNLPASRLSALLLVAAAALVPGCRARAALRSLRRDARLHRSPNAGWPEAAMAGALGLRLAGPRVYGGVAIEDHWMGDGRAEADRGDILRALRLYRAACLLMGAGVAGLCALAWLASAASGR